MNVDISHSIRYTSRNGLQIMYLLPDSMWIRVITLHHQVIPMQISGKNISKKEEEEEEIHLHLRPD